MHIYFTFKGSTFVFDLHLEVGDTLSVESEQLDLVDLLTFSVHPNFNSNKTFTPTPTPIKTTTEMTETSQKTTSQENPTTTISVKSTTMKAGSSGQTEGTPLCIMAMLFILTTNL